MCAEDSCLHAFASLEASACVLPGPNTNTTSCTVTQIGPWAAGAAQQQQHCGQHKRHVDGALLQLHSPAMQPPIDQEGIVNNRFFRLPRVTCKPTLALRLLHASRYRYQPKVCKLTPCLQQPFEPHARCPPCLLPALALCHAAPPAMPQQQSHSHPSSQHSAPACMGQTPAQTPGSHSCHPAEG